MSSGGGDMSEKDPAIKLFGRKITLPECQIPASSHVGSQIPANSGTMDACSSLKETEEERPCAENSEQQDNSSELGSSKKQSQHNVMEKVPKVYPEPVEDKVEATSTDQDKVLKKPDKILQCPRCNSLDTKFCYFNNYNVNQPRHFCKNCQRYWTAGGTMRNVPVGAGRRKNKHLASQFQRIIVASDGIPTSRLETTDSSSHQLISSLDTCSAPFRSSMDNGTVLKFGPDATLCESMESILNLRDQKRSIDVNMINCAENGEEPSLCGSSVTNAGTQGNDLSELTMQRDRGVSNEVNTSHSLQGYPLPPWIFPWNPGWNNVASITAAHQSSERTCSQHSTDPTPMQWFPPPLVAVPGFCPPSIPLQFVPASYWSGTPVWRAPTWTVSIGSNGCLSPSSSTSNSCCSGNGSPTLGKHSRDTVFTDGEKSEKCVLVPKTLRIDDPNEASKSPIWATLGIKPDKQESVSDGTILKKIEPKGKGEDRVSRVSQVLEANPAAISRAHAFQESI